MRIDKTLKQFIATVLTIIMIVTVIPFVPVALGIETEEESENYAYATDEDFMVVIGGDADTVQYKNASELKGYINTIDVQENIEIILQKSVVLENKSALHIIGKSGTGVITLNLNGHNITSNYGEEGPESCATVRVDNRPLVITGAGIIENTYPNINYAFGTAVMIKGTSFYIGENVELKAPENCVALFVNSLGSSEFLITNGIYNGDVELGYDAQQNIRVSGGKFLGRFTSSAGEDIKFVLDGGIYYLYEGNFNNYEIAQGYTVAAIQPDDPDYKVGYLYAWRVVAEEPGGGDTPEGPGGEDTLKDCFNLTAVGGDVTVKLKSYNSAPTIELKYTTDGANWVEFIKNTEYAVAENKTIYIRATDTNSTFNTFPTAPGYYRFVFGGQGKVSAAGSIMFLLTSSGALDAIQNSAFKDLFKECTSLISAPELPATTLVSHCYRSMFAGCTSLTCAPELPATTLASHCYNAMFDGCVSLKKAPNLSAESLAESCYYAMFRGCTAMTEGPSVLPATEPKSSCYEQMFANCSSLTSSPDIRLLRTDAKCCDNMFENASKLCKVTVHFTRWLGTTNWLLGVAKTGTFICPDGLPMLERNANHVPEGWIVGESMTGYYANVVPGTITLKYSGVTVPAIKSVTYLDGKTLTGNDVVTFNNEDLTIKYNVLEVDKTTSVAGCIYKITYTVDSKSYVMNVNTRIKYAEIVNDTSSLANAVAKARNVVSDTFASPSVKGDLNFVSETSEVDNNLYCSQANKNSLNSVISANEGKINSGNDQDTLDKAAAAVDIARINYLQSCTAQLLSVEGHKIKTTNASNVAFWSISYYPEPGVMGGNYSLFEDARNGGMQTIKNPGKNKELVTVQKDGTYTFFVVCGIDGVSRGFFVYVSVGEEPSKEVILASVAAFTNEKTQNYTSCEVELAANANDGTIQVTGTNIDDVIASYSDEVEFNQYNQFVMAGYTGLTSITRENTQDGKRLTGFVGAARDGKYSFRVSFLNGESLCTTVAIEGVPEPVEFASDNKGNITWTAKRGAVVENMSYVLGDQMSNASSAGFLPIQSGTNQVAALDSNTTHTFKIRLLANGTRYTYYQTVTSGECNTPAVVVMSSAIGVYPRDVANIESIAYAQGNIGSWDDMTKAAGVTYVPIVPNGITLDKTGFNNGTYTFMFKTDGGFVKQVVTVK